MGLMSAMVSLRPSLRNHSHDFFWMSMRFGRGSGWSSLANDVRTRGALGSFKRVSSYLAWTREKEHTIPEVEWYGRG